MPHHPPRVGLIGAGGISRVHVDGWLDLGVDVVVHSDEGAVELAEQYGLTVAETLDGLLDGCDVVDICTPTPSHLAYVEAALVAGRHVICEKPVSLDLARAASLGDLASARGLCLFPAQVVRWFPQYAAAKRAVDDGVVGDVAVLRFSRHGGFPTWSSWFGREAESGGIVADQMTHDLDVARWIAGEVVEVYATASGDGVTTAAAQVLLTHESGAISAVNGLWGAPGTTFRTAFSIAGSGGVLEHDTHRDDSFRIETDATGRGPSDRPDSSFTESPYTHELRDFLGAIRGGGAPRVTWADGVRAAELALAANTSIRTGSPVATPATRRTAA
ncbi:MULTISPECIES: Gfo/Idh/MocA family protein [unclassified Isoptericola]|uniref:Gfo/Idh/MocA family protein n=1 Tax=unclassified Isoptericola TaxID=2623355 RepID=UPI00365B7E22